MSRFGKSLLAKKEISKKRLKLMILHVFLCLLPLGWMSGRAYKTITFNRNCEGRLKRVADANTINVALPEINAVIDYLEKNKMTEGYTSLVYTTPDEDVTFWYQNLKAIQTDLQTLSFEKITPLEQSNVLMKVRETILDETPDGVTVTHPSGISIFPNNHYWFILGMISWLLLGIVWYSNFYK